MEILNGDPTHSPNVATIPEVMPHIGLEMAPE